MNVRIIAATQVDLEAAISDGRFRSDLYWRLNVIHIPIPPLRERRDDILYLAHMFIRRQADAMGRTIEGLSGEAEEKLLSMPFRGNVRELKNMLERAVILCDGPRIDTADLGQPWETENASVDDGQKSLKNIVNEAERDAIYDALNKSKWSIAKTAETLGISRKNLWEKMRRHNLQK